MGTGSLGSMMIVTMILLSVLGRGTMGIRFEIDIEECLSHDVQYEGDSVHVSFVVIQSNALWRYASNGVDLVIKGPSGEQIHDFRGKTSEKYEFMARKRGLYRFCFTNKSPYPQTLDFDVHVPHFVYYDDQHAKDEHFTPLLEQISKLEAALFKIEMEQHWFAADTESKAIVNLGVSRRAIHKAMFESALIVGASVFQVYILKRLLERQLGTSRA
ncbi:hypothetical protein RJ640_011890 [Escallonia rubra]|uniref:GOLD domain-containing protein n=1 Tax=Escallonia rubra TaxID=112253 RepID=A0AA88RCS9_9ASTE|nr:hypothetical protein RJ640_011890 [Escallonia rubra]